MSDKERKETAQQASPAAQDKGAIAANLVKKDKLKRFLAQKQRNAVWVAAIVAILMAILYLCGALNGFDSWARDVIISARFDGATFFFKQLTQYLNPFVLALVITVIAAFGPGRHPALSLTLNTAAAFLLNEILKVIFTRERPTGLHLLTETGYSFPSGHSVLAMAFFGFIIWLIWQALRDRAAWKWFLTLIFACIIFSIGFSRVYLGVHWLSDVIEGWAVGFIWLMFFIKVCAPRLQNSEVVLKTTAFYRKQGQEGVAKKRTSNRLRSKLQTTRLHRDLQEKRSFAATQSKNPSAAPQEKRPSAQAQSPRSSSNDRKNASRK